MGSVGLQCLWRRWPCSLWLILSSFPIKSLRNWLASCVHATLASRPEEIHVFALQIQWHSLPFEVWPCERPLNCNLFLFFSPCGVKAARAWDFFTSGQSSSVFFISLMGTQETLFLLAHLDCLQDSKSLTERAFIKLHQLRIWPVKSTRLCTLTRAACWTVDVCDLRTRPLPLWCGTLGI